MLDNYRDFVFYAREFYARERVGVEQARKLTFEVVPFLTTYTVWAVVETWQGNALAHVSQAQFPSWKVALGFMEMTTLVWRGFHIPYTVHIRRSL